MTKEKYQWHFRNVLLEFNSKEEYTNFKNLCEHIDLLEASITDAREKIGRARFKIKHFSKLLNCYQSKAWKLRKTQQEIITNKTIAHRLEDVNAEKRTVGKGNL